MLIVDIIQDSFQEFKDHISLVLFSFGCNFDCRDCYNHHFVTDEKNIKNEAKVLVDKLITPIHDAVVFLGGEPTVWKEDLIECADYVKSKGLKVKIFTNGFLHDIISGLNKLKLVDAYSVDFKTVRNVNEIVNVKMNDEEYLYKVNSSLQNIIEHKIPLEIRTTKLRNVDVIEVQEYVKEKYPFVEHIIQDDFTRNLKLNVE